MKMIAHLSVTHVYSLQTDFLIQPTFTYCSCALAIVTNISGGLNFDFYLQIM